MPLSLWLSPKLFCNSCSHPVHWISAIIWTSFQFYCVFSLAFYCFFLFAFECLWMSVSVSGCLLMSVLFSDVVCTVERRYVHWQSNAQTPGLHRAEAPTTYILSASLPLRQTFSACTCTFYYTQCWKYWDNVQNMSALRSGFVRSTVEAPIMNAKWTPLTLVNVWEVGERRDGLRLTKIRQFLLPQFLPTIDKFLRTIPLVANGLSVEHSLCVSNQGLNCNFYFWNYLQPFLGNEQYKFY